MFVSCLIICYSVTPIYTIKKAQPILRLLSWSCGGKESPDSFDQTS